MNFGNKRTPSPGIEFPVDDTRNTELWRAGAGAGAGAGAIVTSSFFLPPGRLLSFPNLTAVTASALHP